MLCQLLSALLLFLCHHVKVGMLLLLFWRKSEIFPEVHCNGYYCFITLTNKIVITRINSVHNLVVTGTNLLRKHQMKNICFSLITFNQSKIQFETLEHYRDSEEHLAHHLQLLTREKPWIYTDLSSKTDNVVVKAPLPWQP